MVESHLEEEKARVQQNESMLGATFMNFEAFLKNLEQLESVFGFVARGLKEDKQFNEVTKQSEADKMLSELG